MPERETMNVSLSPELKAFVKAQVHGGRYRNDSEVVRAALRLLEDAERRVELDRELLAGLKSGKAVKADDNYWESLRKRLSESSSPRGTARDTA